jgi:hypothetical protein
MQTQPILVEDITDSFIQKFLSLIEQTDDCWPWKGTINTRDGYAQISRNHVTYRASRLMYYITHKVDPHPFPVLHTCDNRACVKPIHLYLGTYADNMRDRRDRGRSNVVGEQNVFARLTEEQVRLIKFDLLNTDISQTKLALKYNVSQATISGIWLDRNWKHVVL